MRHLYLQVAATPDKLIFDEIAFRAESAEPERQMSCASQIRMILGGAASGGIPA